MQISMNALKTQMDVLKFVQTQLEATHVPVDLAIV